MSRALQLQHVAIGGIGAVLRVRQSSVVRQAASEPSGEISSRKAKPNLASCFEGGDKRRARARHRTHGSSTCGGRTSSRRACLSRTSHGHARGLSSFSLPSRHSNSLDPLFTGGLLTTQTRTPQMDIRGLITHQTDSDTAPRTYRPFSFACRTSTSSMRVLATPSR